MYFGARYFGAAYFAAGYLHGPAAATTDVYAWFPGDSELRPEGKRYEEYAYEEPEKPRRRKKKKLPTPDVATPAPLLPPLEILPPAPLETWLPAPPVLGMPLLAPEPLAEPEVAGRPTMPWIDASQLPPPPPEPQDDQDDLTFILELIRADSRQV